MVVLVDSAASYLANPTLQPQTSNIFLFQSQLARKYKEN